jgi:hypothetical protein
MWVGSVRLPAGDHEVRHAMQGEEHVMVFRHLFCKSPAETRVKCHLAPVLKPIKQTEVGLTVSVKGEEVLHRLTFNGDRAEHLF